jgi:hypothetical protein
MSEYHKRKIRKVSRFLDKKIAIMIYNFSDLEVRDILLHGYPTSVNRVRYVVFKVVDRKIPIRFSAICLYPVVEVNKIMRTMTDWESKIKQREFDVKFLITSRIKPGSVKYREGTESFRAAVDFVRDVHELVFRKAQQTRLLISRKSI